MYDKMYFILYIYDIVCVCIYSADVWVQGLTYAREVLYDWDKT
jgi:hypothetical protein